MSYHVIEFEELPYPDIGKYICVPESWIKWRNELKGQVIVAYPVEKPSRTQRRVENDAKYSRNWKCFMAKAEYNTRSQSMSIHGLLTDGYNEALNFIKYLNNKRNRETEDSNKKQQNEEKRSCSNTSVPDDWKTHDNETSDDDTYVLSDLEKDESDTADGNTSVPVGLKTQDDETTDDDDTYVPSDSEKDEIEPSDDYASSDESEKTVPPYNHKPSEQSRGKTKIILPPEYDPDFPRWSLKYPESNYRGRMDLAELRPGGKKTGIYVDRRGYDKCFEVSDTDNTLARNLMMEIFTKSALRVCTLTGKVPAGFEGDKSEIRPGLYVHAVNALVQTVLIHGFNDSEESTIRSCLSAKLYHLRFKL